MIALPMLSDTRLICAIFKGYYHPPAVMCDGLCTHLRLCKLISVNNFVSKISQGTNL